MPKQSMQNKLNQIASKYPDLKTDGKILFCKVCNKTVSAERIFTVKQHLESAKHIDLNNRNLDKKVTQQLLGQNSKAITNINFAEDLCSAFIDADIPLYKIRHASIKSFLERYTEYSVPSETNLRSVHVASIYKASVDNIRKNIKNRSLWLSIDETTDAAGRHVANVIIGILDVDDVISKQKFLLNIAVLDSANHFTIARLFDESIKILGEDFNKDLILLFITDAAPYMIKAARAIHVFYPKITHLTCVIHGLHRVCEQIRGLYPNVDRLIANIKSLFEIAIKSSNFKKFRTKTYSSTTADHNKMGNVD